MSSTRKFPEIPELVKHVLEYTNHAPSYLAAAQTSKLFYKSAKELSEEKSSRGINIRNLLTRQTKTVSQDIRLEKEVRKNNFVFFPKRITNEDALSYEFRRIGKSILAAIIIKLLMETLMSNSTLATSISFLVFIVMMNKEVSLRSENIQQYMWNFVFNKSSPELNKTRLSILDERFDELQDLANSRNFLTKKF